jgi:hypothetical protein
MNGNDMKFHIESITSKPKLTFSHFYRTSLFPRLLDVPLGEKTLSLSPTSPKGKRSTSGEKWNDEDSSGERHGGENGRNSRSGSRVKKDFSDKDILDIKVVRTHVRTDFTI